MLVDSCADGPLRVEIPCSLSNKVPRCSQLATCFLLLVCIRKLFTPNGLALSAVLIFVRLHAWSLFCVGMVGSNLSPRPPSFDSAPAGSFRSSVGHKHSDVIPREDANYTRRGLRSSLNLGGEWY